MEQSKRLYFDGAMGTLLQDAGLKSGELPETWNITHPDVIRKIHNDYATAGANIIKTNTFGANSLKFENLEEIVEKGVELAKFEGVYTALDIGPLGKMLKPLGEMDFEEAVSIFARTVKAGVLAGADLILIETMSDTYETKAAVIAAKENSDLPVFVTCAFDEKLQLMTGADPKSVIAMLEGLGVDAIGMNCGYGPEQMKQLLPDYLKYSSLPIIVNSNAGLPESKDGKTVYNVSPEDFAKEMTDIVKDGAVYVGGCCGTTPEHIKALIDATKDLPFSMPKKKNYTLISSYTHSVTIGEIPLLIGERINPTGKPKLKEALRNENYDYVLSEGISQQENGAHILDVNAGLPDIDETAVLSRLVTELQAVTDLPLQIDTASAPALEKALRIYNGKPLINSVNGKKESIDAVFPLVKKYGGAVIALTLDERGIPDTSDERVKIAEHIISEAERYGIDKNEIIVDPLAMAISADKNSANVTLKTIKKLHEKGIKTSLGVSNVSFGLPSRGNINSVFFTLALNSGLDLAIMNPFAEEMKKAYFGYLATKGLDENFERYISFCEGKTEEKPQTEDMTLTKAIIKGLKEQSAILASKQLVTDEPLTVINEYIIPALDEVGKGFENKTVFLPQLLMSAESAKYAFNEVKKAIASSGESKGKVILATVKGDIHDIGKNIVKVLLENYGYDVIDLGRDVPPETVVKTALQNDISVIGLSALMTTTVVSMEETIAMLKKAKPDCKVIVGGAVLNQEYADKIKADFYAKDAMETVRICEQLFGK